MKNKNYGWLLVSLLFLLAACQSKPGFINHPAPNLSLAFEGFEDAGCPKGEYGFRSCNSDSPLAALGCDEIQDPSDLIGGLEPSYPIALCQVDLIPGETTAEMESEIEQGQYIYGLGGLSRSYIRYVLLQNGEFHLIRSEDEFRDIYAPIETPEEALSYVLSVKKLSAYYGLEYNPAYEYEVDTIEDTYVSSETDGYGLHLYSYQVFGCGPHWASTVEIHISFEGIIQEISRQQVFRDPNEDGLCVD